jgi:hypothetical protein
VDDLSRLKFRPLKDPFHETLCLCEKLQGQGPYKKKVKIFGERRRDLYIDLFQGQYIRQFYQKNTRLGKLGKFRENLRDKEFGEACFSTATVREYQI